MYGVVLMMAVTAGSESADLGRRNRGGCCGCRGTVASCYGCYGGRSYGCYGGGCYGGGCYGGGCYGGGCYGGGYGCGGYAAAPVYYGCGGGVVPHQHKKMAYSANAATVIVSLPADAKLTIDGVATTSTSAERTFESPALEPGKVYSYTLEASYLKDGKTVTVSKKVKIEAGKVSNVDLLEAAPATGVARN